MTKAENRAAARAYQQQKLREMAQQVQQERINADLVELDRLRNYLIFKSKTGCPSEALRSAIDDYVEALTGDRRALHGQGHRCAGPCGSIRNPPLVPLDFDDAFVKRLSYPPPLVAILSATCEPFSPLAIHRKPMRSRHSRRGSSASTRPRRSGCTRSKSFSMQ